MIFNGSLSSKIEINDQWYYYLLIACNQTDNLFITDTNCYMVRKYLFKS